MTEGNWYWCLKHHAAEPYEGCKSEERLGPYRSRDDANNALEKVRERNARWDDEDDD
ncbi:MAG: hypothetical protein QM619_04930 [Micropruina sp.]|uniref:SPOR domain-containing protein n=1 Tax=Micropruina sp. TaxID=2737536 RepID=UPI0039E33D03